MNAFRILFAAFGLVMIAVWYVPTMIWGYQISASTAAAHAGELTLEEDAAAQAKLARGPAPLAWLRDRAELRDLYRLDELTKARRVSFDDRIDFEALLASGEAMPDDRYRDLYAMGRAPAFFAPRCAEILQTIGRTCKLYTSKGRGMLHDRASLNGSMAYIPSYDLGDPSVVKNGKIIETYVRLIPRDDTLAPTSDNRIFALGRAAVMCEGLRAVYGNCVISTVNFAVTGDKDAPKLDGFAELSVYADQTKTTEEALKTAAERLEGLLGGI